jgi:hypothetical protein
MYVRVFSASNRMRSGSKTGSMPLVWLGLRKELESALLSEFDPEAQAYVLAVKTVPRGIQWEIYRMKQVSSLISIRGRLEHRERRRRGNRPGFDHTVLQVKQDADGRYVIYGFMPLTVYLWRYRSCADAPTPELLRDLFPETAQ